MEVDVRKIPISQINPAPYNPRQDLQPDDPEYKQIDVSLETFGYVEPVVWNQRTGNLVGGHQRLKMFIARGMTEVQVSVVDLDEDQERALNIALNNSHGKNDDVKLAAILTEIREKDPDLAIQAGYDEERFGELMAQFSGGEEEPPPEPPMPPAAEPVTRTGDVWEFPGGHRLVCGDGEDPEVWAQLLSKGELAQAVITYPPYGVSYEGAAGTIAGDEKRGDDLSGFLLSVFQIAAQHARDDAAFYIWHAMRTRGDFETAMLGAGLQEKQYIVWAKDQFAFGRADYHWQSEFCFYAQKSGHSAQWFADRTQSTVWRINSPKGTPQKAVSLAGGIKITDSDGNEIYVTSKIPKKKNMRTVKAEEGGILAVADDETTDTWQITHSRRDYDHPTQKPTELAARSMRNSTLPQHVVVDPFAGAGFVLLAAEALKRRARCIELKPEFCDVICKRYLAATGTSPVRRGDGFVFGGHKEK